MKSVRLKPLVQIITEDSETYRFRFADFGLYKGTYPPMLAVVPCPECGSELLRHAEQMHVICSECRTPVGCSVAVHLTPAAAASAALAARQIKREFGID